jgi:hypothetical protein
MKDRLEEFVHSQREGFDIYEPDERLWKGIEKKLDKSSKRRIGFYLYRVAGVAAIFIITIFSYKFLISENTKISEIPELQEAEIYYTGLIDSKLDEVRPLLSDYPDIQKEIDSDLTELDSVYKSLKEDLKDNVSNHEVIEAMVDNYRMRIEILEEMLQYLESKNEDNTKNKSEYEL